MRLTILTITICLLNTGCTSKTEFGQCIGILDERDPNLVYKVHVGNMVISLLGLELILPPVYWFSQYALCPIEEKK